MCEVLLVSAQSLTLPLQDQAVGPKQDFDEEEMMAVLKVDCSAIAVETRIMT